MNDNDKRIARERAIVRGLIRALRAAGWQPHSVFDGEERGPTTTETAMIDAGFSVDFATLYFKHDGAPKRCCVQIVPGNDCDVIHDHSAPDVDPAAFAATVGAYMDTIG